MGGKSKSVVTGYRYYMGLHFGVCHGPIDALTEIRVGDRIAWTGEQTFSGSILVNSPDLFGGDKREGGVQGIADVMGGEPTQGQNQYLADKIGGDDSSTLVPNFRGIFSLVFRGAEGAGREDGGGLVTSNNPYVKPWAFKVRRITEGWGRYVQEEVTETSTDQIYPWEENATDPRNPDNEHEYSLSGVTYSESLGTVFSELETNLGYSLNSELIGFSLYNSTENEDETWGGVLASLFPEVEAGDKEVVFLHYNRNEFDRLIARAGGTLDSHCGALVAAGVDTLDPIVWYSGIKDDGSTYNTLVGESNGEFGTYLVHQQCDAVVTPPVDTSNGEQGLGTCDGFGFTECGLDFNDAPVVGFWADQLIRVRRVPTGPAIPGSEFPDYPLDPENFWWNPDTGQTYSKEPFVQVAGSYRWLAIYSTDGGTGEITRYPQGPVVLQGASGDDEATWTAAYEAAVLAGTLPSGMTYEPLGIGGINTYPRNQTYAWSRTYLTAPESDPWEEGIARIGDCMNPAHIIYQCLTDAEWGMGYPIAQIDEANFLEAAQTLFDEGFGLCLIWNQQSTIEEFVQLVLDHIGAVYYADPRTGFFKLKLIRDDYDESDLPLYDESNILSLDSFQRGGYGETVNEVSVVYTDATTDKETAITVQDLANIQAQGAVVTQVKQYPGITDGDLAARVAQRDLLAGSTPLAKIVITVNRDAWDTVPGDVVKVSWDKLGLSSVICRVLKVNTGTLTDGAITLELAEDVFGLPDSSYSQQEDNGWVEPDNTPDDVSPADAFEIPYWDLVRDLSAGDLAALDADTAYIGTLGVQGAPVELEYRIWSRIDTGDFDDVGTGPFSPGAFAVGAIAQSQTVIPYTGAVNLDLVNLNSRAQIGTGRFAEYVLVTAKDTEAGEITVSRGILDTTPQSHASNAPIFFVEETNAGFDPTERATGETTELRLTAISSSGESDLDDATTLEVTPDQRQHRPYPPGNVTVNGEAFPTEIVAADNPSESLVVTWAHRDRIQQTATYIEQDEGNIGPEAGTTYTIRIYDTSDESLQYSATGLTSTAQSIELTGVFNARLELTSVRDGVESWQPQSRTFDYIGSALLLTEDEDRIITEDGDYMTPEE